MQETWKINYEIHFNIMNVLKRYITLVLVAVTCIMARGINVIPKPNRYTENQQVFYFNDRTRWVADNENVEVLLSELFENFRVVANFQYKVELGIDKGTNNVIFKTNSNLKSEAYTLNVDHNRITIEASGYKGFHHAVQTLLQLLPLEFYQNRLIDDFNWPVQGVTINDAPRFGYRGFMLDVSRYYMPKKELFKLIDQLSFHKINYLHLHLVDDNGWRLQIKKYPELTDIGAWRVERKSFFSMRKNPVCGEPRQVGGYYTQSDMRKIIAYAQQKCIEIIPEIEMPAHTLSSLAAFNNLCCPVVDKPIDVLPGIGGSHSSIIYCAGNDSVYAFLEDIIDEVCNLFPSEYIHIGGDEASKDYWEKCPLCQQRIKKEGLACTEELQGYFINRMASYIKQKGKRVMGWDELTNSAIPEGTTIMGWRGMGQAALKAADQKHPIIMTPAKALYLIRYQGPQWFEPYTYFGNNTLKDVYTYDPLDYMTAKQADYLKGIQACLWTEFVSSPEDAEYLIFPRLAAFAESAWTNPERKNWAEFIPRMDTLNFIYQFKDIHYAHSANNLFHTVKPLNGKLQVSLKCIRPDVEIRYTLDGTEPTSESLLYKQSFIIQQQQKPRAAAFKNGQCIGEVLTLNCQWNLATGKPVESKSPGAFLLTNGLLGSEKNTDGEYIDLYNKDGEFVIDLLQPTEFSELTLHTVNNSGGAVHLPGFIEIAASEDGNKYNSLSKKYLNQYECFETGIFKKSDYYCIVSYKSSIY